VADTPLASPAPPSRLAASLRPRVILPVLAVVLLIAVLWTPNPVAVDTRLTTYSTSPGAAAGIYEVATRLGWNTKRRRSKFTSPLDTTAVYAALGGTVALTPSETHVLLDAVRHGAGLVYVLGDTGVVEDSIHMARSDSGFAETPTPETIAAACAPDQISNTLAWFRDGVHFYRVIDHRNLPIDVTEFIAVDRPGMSGPDAAHWSAAVGVPFGRGRLVTLSDPDLMRNDVVRVCKWDVGRRVVEALDWVSAGRRPTLIFDEYHQGYGTHPSMLSTIQQFLLGTTIGRGIAQGLAAALVLMLALGARPIPPRDVPRIERRSPLEHVDALALAYERIGASRLAARRLAAGLRRRHGRGAWSGRSAGSGPSDADERFLGTVAAGHPEVAADAARILAAEQHIVSPAELLAVADAVDHIDQVFPSPKP
jgi:hypothetical protein